MSVEDRESIAREAGWIPETEWDTEKPTPRGGFKSADEFLDDAPRILLSATKANKKLQAKFDKLASKLEETVTDSRAVNALVQQGYEREKREKDRLQRELERTRQVAIDEGDSEAALAADREIRTLEVEAPQSQVDPAAELAVQQWVDANPWYTHNPDLRNRADLIGQRLDREGALPPGPARLAAVEAEVRRLYPDELTSNAVVGGVPGNPEGARATTQKTSGRTFDDLPNDAQEAYHRFKTLNPSLTKPQFITEYEWE